MPTGRPSKLTAKIIEQAKEYVEGGWAREGDKIPSHMGLAVVLEVAEKTLYNWGEKDGRFLQILEKCNTHQKRVLMNNGLSGEFNSAICKLALGKHGYHEKTESDVNVRGDFLDALVSAQKD